MARGKRTGGKIRIDELVDAVMRELDDFGGYVTNTAIREAVKKTSEDAVKDLKATSPRGRTGKYAESWTSDPANRPKAEQYSEIVYSDKPYYRLTHLLEKGHRILGGKGRKVNKGKTSPEPHIGPVEEGLGEKIEKFLREEVSKY